MRAKQILSESFAGISVEAVMARLGQDPDLQEVVAAHFDYHPGSIEAALAKPATYAALLEQTKRTLAPFEKQPNRLYRGSSVPLDLTQPVGRHWTLDREVAEDIGGPILYSAIVAPTQVDWVGTLARAMFWWQEEKELTLLRGEKIALEAIV